MEVEELLNLARDEIVNALRTLNLISDKVQEIEKKPLIARGKKSFSKDEFREQLLKINNNEDLKLSKVKGKNGDFTNNQLESELDNMKYSISFREKENRYMGRFTLNGKRECAYGKTKTECIDNLRKKRKEILEKYSDNSIQSKNNLNNWFDYWRENIYKPRVKESTYLQTIELYDRHIKDTIGKIDVKKLTTFKLQKFINDITSYVAQSKLNTYLKSVFDMLQKMAIIKINPMALVVIPKKDDENIIIDQEEVKILSYKDELTFLQQIKDTQCYYAVKFILYTGLRKGECIGLQWKHIDLEKMQITIKQQFNGQTKKITTTKSKAGNRVIPILPQACEVLNYLIKNKKSDDDFVFDGINRLTQQLVYHSSKLDFKVNPHMLRHTFASRCYFAGLDPKIIQSLLGHENIDTTLNTCIG